jgi:hypothetical protein
VIHCGSTSRRGDGSVPGRGPVRAAVGALRRLGFVTGVRVSSVSRRYGQPELARPPRVTPSLERAVFHRAQLSWGRVRVLGTAEFDGDGWAFVVRRYDGYGCPHTRNTGDAWGWVAQATEHALRLPVRTLQPSTPSPAPIGMDTEADREQRRALAVFVDNDQRATWSYRFVGTTLVYEGTYHAEGRADPHRFGRRLLAVTGPAWAYAEQLSAEGAVVWRHAGPPLEVIERLSDVPAPGERGSPVRALSACRALGSLIS